MFFNKQSLDASPKAFELKSETLLRSRCSLITKQQGHTGTEAHRDSSLPTSKSYRAKQYFPPAFMSLQIKVLVLS